MDTTQKTDKNNTSINAHNDNEKTEEDKEEEDA